MRVDPAERRVKILVVDDDRDLVDLLGYLVEQAGFTPVTAYEPVSALELFESEAPCVVLVDLNMSPSDGFELVSDLRKRSSLVPILVLTARSGDDDKVRALDLGADD